MALTWREALPPPGEPAPLGEVPEDTVVYAIGDIHGRDDLLAEIQAGILLDATRRQARRYVLVYLGDYFSRGRDSRAVVERVLSFRPPSWEVIALKGNHEDLMLRFIAGDLRTGRHWLNYGGTVVLAQYGLPMADPAARAPALLSELREGLLAALPQAHRSFLEGLPLTHREGDYFFVHAGVRPGVPLGAQLPRDLVWIRQRFLQAQVDHGAVVVHGHCIAPEPEVRRNRIGIDTGAYASGVLTCLALERGDRRLLQTKRSY